MVFKTLGAVRAFDMVDLGSAGRTSLQLQLDLQDTLPIWDPSAELDTCAVCLKMCSRA